MITLVGWLAALALAGGVVWIIVDYPRASQRIKATAPTTVTKAPRRLTRDIVEVVTSFVGALLTIGLLGAGLYGLVKFIKFAWYD